jgi:hypothetical protein
LEKRLLTLTLTTILMSMGISIIMNITIPTKLQTLMQIWGNTTSEFGALPNEDEWVKGRRFGDTPRFEWMNSSLLPLS